MDLQSLMLMRTTSSLARDAVDHTPEYRALATRSCSRYVVRALLKVHLGARYTLSAAHELLALAECLECGAHGASTDLLIGRRVCKNGCVRKVATS